MRIYLAMYTIAIFRYGIDTNLYAVFVMISVCKHSFMSSLSIGSASAYDSVWSVQSRC